MSVTAYKKQRGGLMVKSLSLALLIILCLMPLSIEAETGKEQLELARMGLFLVGSEDEQPINT